MKKKVLIVTKHLRIGGTEKMLLRALPIWNSLGFDIDILLLYNDITLLDDELNNYNISFIFSEKSNKAKQKMKEVPDLIYQKYIKKDYDIEIAFQEGFPTKLISRSTNSRSKKLHGYIQYLKNTTFPHLRMRTIKRRVCHMKILIKSCSVHTMLSNHLI